MQAVEQFAVDDSQEVEQLRIAPGDGRGRDNLANCERETQERSEFEGWIINFPVQRGPFTGGKVKRGGL